MTANVLMFLTIRTAHVAVAAVWIGSTVFNLFLLAPALDDSGASGGQVMAHVDRRGLHLYMMTLGLTTVLTGLYLLWRFTGGFDAGVIATHAGIAFGIGGAAGIAAGVIGGGVVGRSGAAMTRLMAAAAGLPEGPAKGVLFSQVALLKHRMKIGSRVVLALQASALVLMTVGHYV